VTAGLDVPQPWLEIAAGDPFGIQTLAYGVVVGSSGVPHAAVRIGEFALPLAAASSQLLPSYEELFGRGSLDGLLAAGPRVWAEVRAAITTWLSEAQHRAVIEPLLIPLAELSTVLPFSVADYVDFFASENHASNVGKIFRPGSNPLTPNWKHIPLGYHGRAGTVIVSGSDVIRPCGQRKIGDEVEFGPSTRLDIEAEVGFVVGVGAAPGTPVPVGRFADHVFGVVLLNDWSARDIQAWESVPLGPFLGKSFATSISSWITPVDALRSARVPAVDRDPPPLPYLDDAGDSWNLDLNLEVSLNGQVLSRPPFRTMYWTAAQMLAHLTVNGASLRPGDLYGSGTVSGPEKRQRGSLLELSWGGQEPFDVTDGTRTFLHDGDEVVITATAPGPGGHLVGVGEVRGRIVPALLPITRSFVRK
jgi:fumarylacetoacetase